MDTQRFNELRDILYNELFIGNPIMYDMGDRIALIAMICYLTNALKKKKPTVTHMDVIRLCMKNSYFPYIDDNQIQILALVCEWFSADCKKFPDLGIKAADMPAKISKLIFDLMPF